jgi:PilZ domain
VGTDGENAGSKRRSQRIHIAIPVLVRGKSGNVHFEETTQTVTVNAHGCMLLVAAQLVRGQQVSIVNPQTKEEVPCVVSFLGKKDGKSEAGIEFSEPSALFWRINFPPEDWDPEERKRPGGQSSQRPPITPPR